MANKITTNANYLLPFLQQVIAETLPNLPNVIDHGGLFGLDDDDHVKYAGADGSGVTRPAYQAMRLSREVIAGDGLTGGGALTADVQIELNLPGTLSASSTNNAAGNHTHAINSSSNPGATSMLLKTDDLGGVILRALSSVNGIYPTQPETSDLGSSSLRWRKAWIGEMDSIVFAKQTVALVGGWMRVGKGEGILSTDLTTSATSYDFGQVMVPNDFVEFSGAGQIETIKIGTLISGTSYNITRDLDGSGANLWPAGTVYSVHGQDGDGWAELNAYDTPRISVFRQGSTYNAKTEVYRAGDVAGWQGSGLTGWGHAEGDYIGNQYSYYTPTTGMVVRGTIRADAGFLKTLTVEGLLSLTTTGELRAGADANNGLRYGYLTNGYYLRGVNGGVTQIELRASDGKFYGGAGAVIIDAQGLALAKTPGTLVGPTTPAMLSWYTDNKAALIATMGPYVDSAGSYGVQLWGEGGVGGTHMLMMLSRPSSYLNTIKLSTGAIIADSLSTGGDVAPVNSVSTGTIYANTYYKGAYNGALFVPLSAPLTSASWSGAARSTTGKTYIDLSSVFGVPDNVRAVQVRAWISDTGSAASNNCWMLLSPNAVAYQGPFAVFCNGLPNGRTTGQDGIVNCDAAGNIYWQTATSGTNTMTVSLEIWGYWI